MLEAYLRAPETSAAERAVFYASWPNFNLTLSHTLLTDPPRLDPLSIRPHLTNVLAQGQTWRADPTLAEDHAALDTMLDRVREILAEAGL